MYFREVYGKCNTFRKLFPNKLDFNKDVSQFFLTISLDPFCAAHIDCVILDGEAVSVT